MEDSTMNQKSEEKIVVITCKTSNTIMDNRLYIAALNIVRVLKLIVKTWSGLFKIQEHV